MSTPPTTTPTGGHGLNPKIFMVGGAILLLVIVFGLFARGCDDGGPAWTKDPRFLHNQQQEAWEMK